MIDVYKRQGIPFEDVLSLFDQELVDASGEFAGDPDLRSFRLPLQDLGFVLQRQNADRGYDHDDD